MLLELAIRNEDIVLRVLSFHDSLSEVPTLLELVFQNEDIVLRVLSFLYAVTDV
jgi:hypothetical protein